MVTKQAAKARAVDPAAVAAQRLARQSVLRASAQPEQRPVPDASQPPPSYPLPAVAAAAPGSGAASAPMPPVALAPAPLHAPPPPLPQAPQQPPPPPPPQLPQQRPHPPPQPRPPQQQLQPLPPPPRPQPVAVGGTAAPPPAGVASVLSPRGGAGDHPAERSLSAGVALLKQLSAGNSALAHALSLFPAASPLAHAQALAEAILSPNAADSLLREVAPQRARAATLFAAAADGAGHPESAAVRAWALRALWQLLGRLRQAGNVLEVGGLWWHRRWSAAAIAAAEPFPPSCSRPIAGRRASAGRL